MKLQFPSVSLFPAYKNTSFKYTESQKQESNSLTIPKLHTEFRINCQLNTFLRTAGWKAQRNSTRIINEISQVCGYECTTIHLNFRIYWIYMWHWCIIVHLLMIVTTDIVTEFRAFDIQNNFSRLEDYLKLHKKR